MSANVATNVVSSGVYNSMQNCMINGSGGQAVIIDGNGNIVNNVNQTMSIQIKAGCFKKNVVDSSLQSAVNNMNSDVTNLSSARSQITDTDYSSETTKMAKAQILSQASTAMIAQANQSTQGVLSLLK